MTGFEMTKKRLSELKDEKEELEKAEEKEVGGSPHQQHLWGRIKQMEKEIEFLESLIENFYNFN